MSLYNFTVLSGTALKSGLFLFLDLHHLGSKAKVSRLAS